MYKTELPRGVDDALNMVLQERGARYDLRVMVCDARNGATEGVVMNVYVSMEEGGTLVSCIRPLTGISAKDSWRWYQ